MERINYNGIVRRICVRPIILMFLTWISGRDALLVSYGKKARVEARKFYINTSDKAEESCSAVLVGSYRRSAVMQIVSNS
jgi:hypothetical protein